MILVNLIFQSSSARLYHKFRVIQCHYLSIFLYTTRVLQNSLFSTFLKYIIFLFFLVLLSYIHFRGFISYDDGWFLWDGLRLLQGEKIYKDFHYLYNPGSLYINALAFKLFGVSIFASRIMAFLNSVISILLLYLISKKITLHPVFSFFLISSYVLWGPGHINFVWPVMFCLTAALATGTLFLYNNKTKHTLFLFLIGILAAYVFILKQNFGLAIFVTNIFYLIYHKEYRNHASLLWYGTGYASILVLQLMYFLYTNTLGFYLHEFYDYTIVKIVQHGILNSALPWQYSAPFLMKVMKFFLYLSPLIASVLSAIMLYKKRGISVLIYFPIIGISYYLLSIRPTTDFIHLTPLISLSLIPLYLLYQEAKQIKVKLLCVAIIFICFFAGIYSAFYRNYYRWNTPLNKQNIYMNNSTLKIFTDSKERDSITHIEEYYKKYAQNDSYTFIYYFTPIYYLILDKKNPTTYDDLQLGGVSVEEQKKIIAILKKRNVNHIITDVDITLDMSPIAHFIKNSYKKVLVVNEYTIWEMNNKESTTYISLWSL
jgi:hypothetical protein